LPEQAGPRLIAGVPAASWIPAWGSIPRRTKNPDHWSSPQPSGPAASAAAPAAVCRSAAQCRSRHGIQISPQLGWVRMEGEPPFCRNETCRSTYHKPRRQHPLGTGATASPRCGRRCTPARCCRPCSPITWRRAAADQTTHRHLLMHGLF